jgi:hypothetical protein
LGQLQEVDVQSLLPPEDPPRRPRTPLSFKQAVPDHVLVGATSNFKEHAMKIVRTGSAAWSGGIKDDKGSISTESSALQA